MTIDGVIIPGQNGRILGAYYAADPSPSGPAPVVLLCHGFPGNDQLQDLALFLQRNGMDVMTFHYSGSWGSDGNYSLENGLSDTNTVLDYLLDNIRNKESEAENTVGRRPVFIVGHSLGGFFAAHTFARRKELRAAALISPANMANMYASVQNDQALLNTFRKELDTFCAPLNGVSSESLFLEIRNHSDSYQFSQIVQDFETRPTLIVRGTYDDVTPAPLCADVLKSGLDQLPGSHSELVTFDTGHDYLNVREDLLQTVYNFLSQQL